MQAQRYIGSSGCTAPCTRRAEGCLDGDMQGFTFHLQFLSSSHVDITVSEIHFCAIMIKLASPSMSPKSPATFHLMFSVLVGFCTMVPVVSGFEWADIDPGTMSCSIAFHQSEYQIESINSRTQDIYDGDWTCTNNPFYVL